MSDYNSIQPNDQEEELVVNDFINSYAIADQIVTSAISSHQDYWDIIKICQKHIAGQKPIDPKELKEKGMGWVYNFNYNKARAKIEKGTAESVSKVSAAIALGYATFRAFRKDDDTGLLEFLQDEQRRGIVAATVGYCLSTTLSRETRLSGWLNEIEYPAYSFGYSGLQYSSSDWMPDPVHPLNIAFQPNSRPENINQWVTFGIMKANDLYDRWKHAKKEDYYKENLPEGEEIISNSGWISKSLEAVMCIAYKGMTKDNRRAEQWEEILPIYNSNPSKVISDTTDVKIAKIYNRELNGTISEVYIPFENPWQKENRGEAKNPNQTSTNVILYKKNHGKYNQSHYIQLIRDSGFSETGYIQDYRGIAKYAVEDSIRYNRIRNSIGNKSIFAGSPFFETQNGQTAERMKLTVHHGYVIAPSTHRMMERQPTFDIATHVNLIRFEESEYNRDTQQYDASIQGRLTSRPNRGEVTQVTREVEVTQNSKNNIKLRDYSAVFLTVLKRMNSVQCSKGDPGYEGKERFYDLMKKNLSWLLSTNEEVNKVLEAIDSYVIEPVISNIDTITVAIQMAETPYARNRFKRMMLIAQGLPIEEVNIAVPLITDRFVNLQDERVAVMENDMFFTTNEIIISGTDDHIVHIDTHLGKCERVLQGFQQERISARNAAVFLENALAHIIQHLEKLSEDPTLNKKAEEYIPTIREYSKAKNQIAQIAQQMAQAEAEAAAQPQIDPETQNEIAKDNAKAIADTERKDWLAVRRTEQRDRQIEQAHEQRLREIELRNQNQG